MSEPTDHELLADYARTGAEAPFAQIVARHIHLVHSAARRYAGSDHLAEEITQAVFLILARKAGSLSGKTVLSGWLYQTARLTAANALKADQRRQRREQEAYMQSQENETDAVVWREIAPLLDDAMGKLGETDRTVLVLRFFERQTNAQVAAALGLAEGAVQKRVFRALEKLRANFAKQGVTHTAQAIAGTVTQNAVLVAPAGLLLKVSVIGAKGAVVSGSTLALVKGTMSLMAWAKAKITIGIGTAVILAAGTAAAIVNWEQDIEKLEKNPPVLILRPTQFPDGGGSAGWGKHGSEVRKQMAVNATIQSLIAAAYDYDHVRIVFPKNLPAEHFDLMITIATNNPEQLLRNEIKRQFGLVGHREIIETNILVLKLHHSNAPNLQISKGGPLLVNGWCSNNLNSWTASWTVSNQTFTGYANQLEQYVGKPITNRIDLTGKYNFHLQWKYAPLNKDRWDAAAAELYQKSMEQALRDQLGLELVPNREKFEMLVIEKVK